MTIVCMATMFTKVYGKQQWEKCLFVPVSCITRPAVAVEKNSIVIGHLPRMQALCIRKTVDRFDHGEISNSAAEPYSRAMHGYV